MLKSKILKETNKKIEMILFSFSTPRLSLIWVILQEKSWAFSTQLCDIMAYSLKFIIIAFWTNKSLSYLVVYF